MTVIADDLLPVELFASEPSTSNVRLSPDGASVAYLARIDTPEMQGMAVRVLNIETGEFTPLPFVPADEAEIHWLRWANNDQLLLSLEYLLSFGGDRVRTQYRLLVVTVESGEVRSAMPQSYLVRRPGKGPSDQGDLVDILQDDPDHVMLQGYFDDAPGPSLYKVSLVNTKVSRIRRGLEGTVLWMIDRQYRPRLIIRRDKAVFTVQHQSPDSKKWRDLWEFEYFDEDEVWPLGFDEDPDLLYVLAYHEGRQAVFKVRLSDPTLEKELVFADPDYDVDGSLIYSQAGSVIGIRYSASRGYTLWDQEYKALQDSLNRALPGADNTFRDMSADERRYILLSSSDTNPGTYYLGDRTAKKLTPLAKRFPGFPLDRMAEKFPISYEARDGLIIEGFLTKPKDVGEGPYPTIVFPHGGPLSRTTGGFDSWTQLFASRGYAVLQMNFRGSAGYGYEHMKAGLQGWGLDMQNDVEDGTRWLIDNGIADPERICAVGASYGGYAALMEVVRNPDLYQCAISMAGVTDVAYLLSRYRFSSSYEVVRKQIGTRRSELRERSPLHNAESIDVPVLIAHGTRDRSVEVEHSRRMFDELEEAGKDVKYIEFEDGDHFLSKHEHRLEFFLAMDEFLQEHL